MPEALKTRPSISPFYFSKLPLNFCLFPFRLANAQIPQMINAGGSTTGARKTVTQISISATPL